MCFITIVCAYDLFCPGKNVCLLLTQLQWPDSNIKRKFSEILNFLTHVLRKLRRLVSFVLELRVI